MKKASLIYSFNTKRSAQVGEQIASILGDTVETLNAEEINGELFLKNDNIIIGCPTWFDGELPNYWDEFVPELEELDLKGKKVAIYGAGDAKGYPENFCDAIGLIANIFKAQGAEIVGYTSTEGYAFESSEAQEGDQFCGLALDFVSHKKLIDGKIEAWLNQLKKEFS